MQAGVINADQRPSSLKASGRMVNRQIRPQAGGGECPISGHATGSGWDVFCERDCL